MGKWYYMWLIQMLRNGHMKAKRDQDGYIESGGRLIVLAEMMRDAYENEV